MDVTLATGLLTITLSDGTTQTTSMGTATDVTAEIAPVFIYGADTASQVTRTDDYFVRIHLNDNRWLDIQMGGVDNQPGWTNDLAGANTARAAIAAIIP